MRTCKKNVFLIGAGAKMNMSSLQAHISPLGHFNQESAPPNLGLRISPKSHPPDSKGHRSTL